MRNSTWSLNHTKFFPPITRRTQHVDDDDDDDESLKLALGQPWVRSVSEFIFLASAYTTRYTLLNFDWMIMEE